MIGSSIINITLIIGLTAVIVPLQVDPLIAKREIPFSLGVQLAVTMMLWTGMILTRSESLLLLVGMVAFSAYLGLKIRRMWEWNRPADVAEGQIFDLFPQQETLMEDLIAEDTPNPTVAVQKAEIPARLVVIFLIGLGTMIVGADLAVDTSVVIAGQLGLSEEFIGLTLVAFGTSLPEVVTCIVAALRKEADIAVGNIIGSNIFNILFVLGLSSTLNPINMASRVFIDLAFMLLATLLLLIPALFRQNISRLSGSVLIGAYVIYMSSKIFNLV